MLTSSLDEPEFAPSDPASLSVDALVNDADSYTESRADLDDEAIRSHSVVGSLVLEQPRRATPTIPPGFSAPSTPKFLTDVPLRPLSRTGAAAITPAVPVIPVTPLRPATPLRAVTPVIPKQEEKRSGLAHEQSTSRNPIGTPDQKRPSMVTQPPGDVKATPTKSKGPVSATSKLAEKTPDNRKEAKSTGDSTTSKDTAPSRSPSKQVKGKKTVSDTNTSTVPASASPQKDTKSNNRAASTSSKRQPPAKLDIAAATKLSSSEMAQPDTASTAGKTDIQAKNPRALSLASTGSHPNSPAVASTGSPVKRTAPRTIRVLPTPKTEMAPLFSASPASSVPPLPNVGKLRSRQASVTSLNQPGTPASELISDNASITSASLSRASSPPPGGKVGSAPLRKKSKAQAKKERQERAKQSNETALEELVKSAEAEPVQAPIIGRKKKTKKPVTSTNTAPTPVMSQPTSSAPTKQAKVEDDYDFAPPSSLTPAQGSATDASKSSSVVPSDSPAPDTPNSTKGRGEPTAASILADLQRTGDLLASTLEFFKPLSASIAHMPRNGSPAVSPSADLNNPPSPSDLKIHLSEADLDLLAKKMAVHLGGEDGKTSSRTLITPQGKFLWGLSKELEERVLELEARIEEVRGITRWHPSKRHNGNGDSRGDVLPAIATALKEAGAKLGKQSQNTVTPWPATNADTKLPPKPPMSFDDALGYLNQWVLPPDTPGHQPRGEQASVGGPAPGSANLAAAAAAGKIPIPDLENLGIYAADVLGGYVVQGLEALMGPNTMGGLGYGASAYGKVGSAVRAGGLQGGAVLSVEEAERAMLESRREAEGLEKKLNNLVKRNKRMLAGGK